MPSAVSNQLGGFLCIGRFEGLEAQRRIDQHPFHFRSWNEQHTIAESSMAVGKKVLFLRRMLREEEDLGPCEFRSRDDIVDLAPRIVRKFRMDMQIGADLPQGSWPFERLSLCGISLDRLADGLEVFASKAFDSVGGTGRWSILARRRISVSHPCEDCDNEEPIP